MKDSRAIVARAAQLVCIDAFRKNLWRDARTTNVIADACFHKLPKIQMTSMKFFLGSKENEEGVSDISEDDEEGKQDDAKTVKEVMTSFRHAKKTRKRTKNLEKVKKAIDKKKKAKKEGRSKECNLFAIQSLYDPQQFVDRLFGMLEGKKVDRFEIRLTRIGLCARLIGIHRLHTLGFYSYLHRYLQPKQRDVTRILLYAAQACHELTPPDTVEQLVRVIVNSFVSDRNSPEAMTVGINAIREIFANCPFAATEELLRDLAEYKTYKNKNVSVAARALITLFRQMNPKLLHRKDRGRQDQRAVDDEREFVGYAKPTVHNFVAGAEILDEREEPEEMEADEKKKKKRNRNEEEDSDSELEVSDVDTDEVDTDSDADEPLAKKKKTEKGSKEEEDDSEGEWQDVEHSSDEEMDDEEIEIDDEEIEFEDEDEEEEMEDEDESGDEQLESGADETGQEQEEEEVEVDPKKKAEDICANRILTQEDFKQIKQYQLKKQLIGEKRLKKQLGKKKRNDDVMLIEEMSEKIHNRGTGDGLPRLRDIEQFYKKKKQTKAERMADIMAGRDEDKQFGKPKKNGPHVGKTNRQNTKKKVAAMVKAKKRGENRQRSFRDRQKSLRNYLLRQSGIKPK
ncbi:hypothetical protein WR25_11757 isoform A [Diploscapter pachys]|uniref:Protein SDA1 n=2 Tax=Diploscapter pachys TaxID=2018661 RepID=A0A2A2JWX8_9BILA|nr:hypothetical protein WR25_11757 isoform A [Diploscapter pachys]